MKSSARLHFPPVRWHGQERRLWNRVWRRSCKDLPEERVRLQFLDWLLLQQEWPPGYIASEQALPGSRLERTDLLCYDSNGKPEWLIECKAPSVCIGERARLQIARYNRELRAPCLCLTNGIDEQWYRTTDEGLMTLDSPPGDVRQSIESIRTAHDYWIDRGFLGKHTPAHAVEPAVSLCRWLYHPDEIDFIFHLGGEWTSGSLPLAHYYRRINRDEERQLAIALLSDADGSSWISILHNQQERTNLLLQIPIAPDRETGQLTGEIRYHSASSSGTLALASLPGPLLLHSPDELVSGLETTCDLLLRT